MANLHWGQAPYYVHHPEGRTAFIVAGGRIRWALDALLAAGEAGYTPIASPGPRWSAYVHRLCRLGVAIETIREPHGGPFAGTHGRYVLRSRVTPARHREAA